ncbi:MAG: MFS transporter [Bacillota bacterium]
MRRKGANTGRNRGDKFSFGLGERAVEYRVLLALVVVQGFTWFLVFPLMPLHASALGASAAIVGFLMAFPAVFQVLICLPAGLLVRRLGERGVFLVSFTLGVAAAGTYYMAQNVTHLFLGQMLFGASHAVFWPALTSYLGDLGRELPEGAGSLISFALGLNAVSYLAGPPLAGYLMDHADPRYVFVIYLVAGVVGLERCRLLAAGGGRRVPTPAGTGSGGEFRSLFAIPTFRFAVLGTWCSFASWGALDALFPLHVSALGYGASSLGFMLTLRSLVIVGCRFSAARFGDLIGFRKVGLLGLALCGFSLVAMSVTASPVVLVLASSLAGAAPGFLPVANITLLAAALSDHDRPLGMAVNELFVGMGRLMGSSASGVVGATLGMAQGLGGAGVVLLSVTGLLTYLSSPGVEGSMTRSARGRQGP